MVCVHRYTCACIPYTVYHNIRMAVLYSSNCMYAKALFYDEADSNTSSQQGTQFESPALFQRECLHLYFF